MTVKVLVKGAVSPYTGYGQDTIGIVGALTRLGLDVYLQPSHVDPPLPPAIAALLTKRLEAPFDLLIHHTDPGQLGVSPEAQRASSLAVGWTMWEYTSTD